MARAVTAGKPIILLHPGRSAGAQESITSHTGALSGDYATMKALVDVVAAVGRLLVDHPEIAEIDVNPLRVYPAGRPALALDALIVLGD